MSPLAHQYFEALRRGERHVASRLVLDAVAAGTPVQEIYLHVFQPAQYEIGRLWQMNRISVAQEHYCSAATQLILSQLYPQIFATAKNGRTLVASCVAGDLHEIGVRMVADFFEMDGWNTFYLGANTPHDGVITSLVEQRADVLAVSATISYHVDAVRDLIRAVRQHPVAGRVRILAGGYPFNRDPALWRKTMPMVPRPTRKRPSCLLINWCRKTRRERTHRRPRHRARLRSGRRHPADPAGRPGTRRSHARRIAPY